MIHGLSLCCIRRIARAIELPRKAIGRPSGVQRPEKDMGLSFFEGTSFGGLEGKPNRIPQLFGVPYVETEPYAQSHTQTSNSNPNNQHGESPASTNPNQPQPTPTKPHTHTRPPTPSGTHSLVSPKGSKKPTGAFFESERNRGRNLRPKGVPLGTTRGSLC